jgi:hypothetical protein
MASKDKHFTFRKHDTVGAPAAEDDIEFLHECFVDTGDFSLLQRMTDNRIIVLGRTGTGKSALFEHLNHIDEAHAITLRPTGLALTHVSGSNVLRYFSSLEINLEPFYKLLWRHVITVEILNRFFSQYVTDDSSSPYDWLRKLFIGESRSEKKAQELIGYLEKWGERFWNETEYRVKEITAKIERELVDSMKAAIGVDPFSIGGEQANLYRLEEQQKIEVVTNAQHVVARAQIEDLHRISDVLDGVLTDRQKYYFVLIDGLDEDWVEDPLRYRLILALIETAREFIRSSNAKVVISLRRDLIDRVFRITRNAGFQEEKYRGLYLPLVWNRNDILNVLTNRIKKMVRHRYTKRDVQLRDLLPANVNGMQIEDFIYSVANRPRDVIAFFNTCIAAAVDKSQLSTRELLVAVGEYSRSRLRALGDEWSVDYPFLLDFAGILNGRQSSFKVDTISEVALDDIILNVVGRNLGSHGYLIGLANEVINGSYGKLDFLHSMLHVFYRVGLIGLKIDRDMKGSWVDDTGQSVSRSQIDSETSVIIAPKYGYALGAKMQKIG